MRILFLGAGAVGGYFGGRMAQTGVDATFLVRGPRAEQLRDGLKIESPLGHARVSVKTLTAGESATAFDLVVLTNKAYGLAGALEAIAPHVNPNTIILPLLNGMSHLAKIEARFPGATVWGGVAQIGAVLAPNGAIQHVIPVQGLIIGPRAGQDGSRPQAEQLVAMAGNANIDARFSDDIEQDLWDKWVFLAALAAGTCLMRSDIGTILKAEHGEALLIALLTECTNIAAAEDHRPADERMAFYRNQLTGKDSKAKASMLRDIEQGGPSEADHIVGDLIRRARKRGLATPNLDIAWAHLQCYENAR
ncbi:MAG: ketopantoate reductase family protein [Chromatiales bacterium]|jgi:2-dehydropantoate 2-reductase|nr:ketopantoate reductase family protein [Chromatiales bacterium]